MQTKHSILIAIFFLFETIVISQTTEVTVQNITEFDIAIKKAIPGSKIILKNGIWENAHLKAQGIGTKNAPILITAETDGKVILTGNSRLNISGKYIIVNGLWFKDGTPTSKEVISFRKDSKNFAYNCRVTNCVISYYNPSEKSIENHWVDLWGRNNRVDHCNFTGKTNGGTTLVVWLKGKEHTENNHRIDHNFFGTRPDLGKNGGETIRIGTSTNSMESSKTLVEFNTFKHCNGEIEIISNKSGDNIFRNNLFIESEGTLTLRHGNNALVENNVFIGNNKPRVGGIRVINEGHIIQNNLLVNIIGEDYRAPIAVMNGIPNSPLNRYHQVKNVVIQNNTLLNCSPVQFGVGKDDEKTLAPINTVFANNLISNTNGRKISNEQDTTNGITFFGNIVDSEVSVNPSQFTKGSIDWQILKSLPMPTSNNEILKTAIKFKDSPNLDISNSERAIFVSGAFNLDNTIFPKTITSKTGPFWKPTIEKKALPKVENRVIIEPGTENISKALKQIGNEGTLVLNPGTYFVEKSMKINGNITIEGNYKKGAITIKSAEKLETPFSYFFRINEGSKLQLKNVTLDGEGSNSVKYAVVSPDENLGEKYNFFVDNCDFINFTNSNGGSVFKAYIGTSADTISFKNSTFINNYRGLNLSYEKSPLGKPNVDVVILYNSLFKNIDEFAVNYYRNDINPLTKGGNLIVDQCVFSRIFNTEKGYVLKTKGITSVYITNSVFENSHEIINSISLSGSTNSIRNCLFYMSGSIKASNNANKEDIEFKSPKWEDRKLFIPKQKSYLLKENNGINYIGLLPQSIKD